MLYLVHYQPYLMAANQGGQTAAYKEIPSMLTSLSCQIKEMLATSALPLGK